MNAPPTPDDHTPGLPIDRRAYQASVQACIHCGLCLPACPTYAETGREADGPRGRIDLMKALADGRIKPTDHVVGHLDLCLDCRACETACPSGVQYHQLIEHTRAALERRPPDRNQRPGAAPRHEPEPEPWRRRRGLADRIGRAVLLHLMPHPNRLKAALLPAKLMHRLGLWHALAGPLAERLPGMLARLPRLAPVDAPLWPRPTTGRYPALSQRRATVGFFPGCVGSVAHRDLDRKAIDLLRLAGAEVIVPRAARCCGAIAHHAAEPDPARKLAQRNIEAYDGVAMVVADIAGCGAMLKQYGELLRDDPDLAQRAASFSAKARDIHQALAELPLPAPRFAVPAAVAYHEACHLVHAQGVRDAPRDLLATIPGLDLRPLDEATMCCGAAGAYNLEQPDMADALGDRKARAVDAAGVDACATANVGCAMHLRAALHRLDADVRVVYPVELLHAAHFGGPDARAPARVNPARP